MTASWKIAASRQVGRLSTALCSLPSVASLALLVTLAPAVASAQPSPADATVAQSLFEQARRLMKDGRFAEACPKLADSLRLDPATGTLLNLAVCHEKQGLTATAWAEFHDALTQAKHDERDERVRFAREHIATIEPVLSSLTVVRAGATRVDVRLDGGLLGDAALGAATPVDPGPHRVEATAPGKRPWKADVDVGPSADRKTVEIPELEDAPPPDLPETPTAQTTPHPERRAVGILLGGAGVAALTVGTLAGIQAASKWNTRKSDCPGDVCNAAGLDADTTSRHLAAVSDVGLGVGVVALGIGTVLVITSRASETRAEVRADVGPGRGGIVVGGVF
jgi:hypothetical protein